MAIFSCGLNHNTAPIGVREQLAFTPATLPNALQNLLQQPTVSEAVILSTCNRTEIYGAIDEPDRLSKWLAQHHELSYEKINPYLYRYQNEFAVKHLLRVACGIDSMVLGEPEIFGQVKQAYQIAEQQGAVGRCLQRLFQTAFNFTKQVRSESGISRCPVSIAFAATQLAKQVFADLQKSCVLLIGAGDTIELVATHLINQGAKRLVVANRSLDKARRLAEKFYGHSITLEEIPLYLQQTDIVVSATANETAVLTRTDIENTLALRKHRPLFLVDLAVPRDIEESVTELDEVYLYNVDDLKTITNKNLQSRTEAASHAEAFIDIQTQMLMRELRTQNAVDTICDMRSKMADLSQQELARAKMLIAKGEEPTAVLDQFTNRLVNKLLHAPSRQLRQAAFDNRAELLVLARRLFEC